MSDRYESREQIGKGGLGAVYKAWDKQLHREVALKRVLMPGEATQEEIQESGQKLIAEAQTLSALNHPNIVTVFDVGTDEKGGFVVMELLNGETIDDTVERGVLTQADFTEVVIQTQEALIAAQAIDVIHRDIKPSNIMVIWQASGKFQTKILDFGLAKFSKAPSVQTMDQDDSVMGSIFFMAPEQFERGELDARTDLYQMGCVYYFALTGQYPFNGETGPQVMNAHMQHKVTPLEQIRPDLSPSICQWVMWLINRDHDHRPKDALEALTRWPKNPEPPGATLEHVLPVEEVEQAPSGAVKVITHASQASAPPQLIIPEPRTGSQPIGAITGRLVTQASGKQGTAARGNTGSYRPGQHSSSIAPPPAPSKMKLWVTLGSVLSAIAIFAISTSIKKGKIRKQDARLEQLANAKKPTGSPNDVILCLLYIDGQRASVAQRADALKVLKTIQGAGIEKKMLEQMKTSESPYVRLKLAGVLSERNYSAAVPAMITAFKAAKKDKSRVQILNAVRGIADLKSVDHMIGALSGKHSTEVRKVFEDTVLAVIRKNSDSESTINSILKKTSTTSGAERKSLYRILGVIGNEKILKQITAIYEKNDNPDQQHDAIAALLSWPDRSVMPLVEKLLSSSSDRTVKTGAQRVFVRLSGLPGPEPIVERVAIWKRCFKTVTDPNDARRLFSSIIAYPAPETLAMLTESAKHKSLGKFAKSAADTVKKMIASAVEIKSGDPLKGNKARVQGNRRVSLNSFLESLTSWNSTDTSFTWNFKMKEAGDYAIIVDQATLQTQSSSFTIFINGKAFEGESKTTETLDSFSPVNLEGTVALEAGKVYTLSLAAGRHVQPLMMDIGAVRLIKK